jgi:hypothetical protein
MLCDGSQWKCATRIVLICTGIALFFAAISEADARTRRQRRASGVQVALQPFSAGRSAIHEIADPIVHAAPRIVSAVATAPIRVAADCSRDEDDLAEDDFHYDADEDAPSGRVYQAEPVRMAERAHRGEPVRVAYVTTTRRADPAPQPQPPRSEEAGNFDDYEPPRRATMPEIESSGSKPMVTGSRAILRNGVAYAPSQAPQSVKNAIWAANSLRRKPYVWGGGHGSFYDRGYDCSGTVSFALHGAGALDSPLPSSEFMRYGERGRGRWITIYSRRGHTFAVIAGLRLDTTDFQNGGNTGPRWHEDGRDTRGYVARHPAGM